MNNKNIEYEYSFKVKSLEKYINYCKNNNYKLVEENEEIRTIYRSADKKNNARITIKKNCNGIKYYLDFKENKLSDDVLITRKESLALEFTDKKAVNSILDFLNYKKDNTLKRKRIIYKLDNVKFELDSYEKPCKEYVVAIEGKKEDVDKVYLEFDISK